MHKIRARGQSAATMQKMIKLYFARKQHFPRAKGLHGLTNMVAEVKELEVMVNKLPKNKEKYVRYNPRHSPVWQPPPIGRLGNGGNLPPTILGVRGLGRCRAIQPAGEPAKARP